jgi:hypothetical protein
MYYILKVLLRFSLFWPAILIRGFNTVAVPYTSTVRDKNRPCTGIHHLATHLGRGASVNIASSPLGCDIRFPVLVASNWRCACADYQGNLGGATKTAMPTAQYGLLPQHIG